MLNLLTFVLIKVDYSVRVLMYIGYAGMSGNVHCLEDKDKDKMLKRPNIFLKAGVQGYQTRQSDRLTSQLYDGPDQSGCSRVSSSLLLFLGSYRWFFRAGDT